MRWVPFLLLRAVAIRRRLLGGSIYDHYCSLLGAAAFFLPLIAWINLRSTNAGSVFLRSLISRFCVQ